MNRNETLAQYFSGNFDGAPDVIARAPGRVNLIGEHTDYNDGFVLPMAIDYDIRIAARARPDRTARLYSVDLDKHDIFSLGTVRRVGDRPTWADYVRGVADVLQREGYSLRGMDAAISGNVPRAAGLSSSAAMELAAITAFRRLSALDLFTTPEIDALVEIQQSTPGCWGARMRAVAWGCAVALVQEDAVPALQEVICSQYPNRTGKTPQVYVCRATDGAGLA